MRLWSVPSDSFCPFSFGFSFCLKYSRRPNSNTYNDAHTVRVMCVFWFAPCFWWQIWRQVYFVGAFATCILQSERPRQHSATIHQHHGSTNLEIGCWSNKHRHATIFQPSLLCGVASFASITFPKLPPVVAVGGRCSHAQTRGIRKTTGKTSSNRLDTTVSGAAGTVTQHQQPPSRSHGAKLVIIIVSSSTIRGGPANGPANSRANAAAAHAGRAQTNHAARDAGGDAGRAV